jgi:PEP-CTERM motif
MRGKLLLGFIACLLLMFTVAGARGEQLQKVSSDKAGFSILPINQGVDPRGPALLDPTVPALRPDTVTFVPEPSTIAMLLLGGGLASLTAIRRNRRR